MWILAFLLVLLVSSGNSGLAQRRMYAWVPPGSAALLELARARNPMRPDVSLITLILFDRVLQIHQVVRGTTWPVEEPSFCSLMLPAAIRDFVFQRGLTLERDVDEILTINAANPEIVGCRCYARTLISLGFDLINGSLFPSSEEFCSSDQYSPVIRASASSIPTIGVSSEKQLKYIADAFILE